MAYCRPDSVRPGDEVALHLSAVTPTVSVEVVRDGLESEVVWRGAGVAAPALPIPDDAPEAGCGWPAAITIPVRRRSVLAQRVSTCVQPSCPREHDRGRVPDGLLRRARRDPVGRRHRPRPRDDDVERLQRRRWPQFLHRRGRALVRASSLRRHAGEAGGERRTRGNHRAGDRCRGVHGVHRASRPRDVARHGGLGGVGATLPPLGRGRRLSHRRRHQRLDLDREPIRPCPTTAASAAAPSSTSSARGAPRRAFSRGAKSRRAATRQASSLEDTRETCFKHRFRDDPVHGTDRRASTTTIWARIPAMWRGPRTSSPGCPSHVADTRGRRGACRQEAAATRSIDRITGCSAAPGYAGVISWALRRSSSVTNVTAASSRSSMGSPWRPAPTGHRGRSRFSPPRRPRRSTGARPRCPSRRVRSTSSSSMPAPSSATTAPRAAIAYAMDTPCSAPTWAAGRW